VVKRPRFQRNPWNLPAASRYLPAHLAAVVDAMGHGVDGARNIEADEPVPVEQEAAQRVVGEVRLVLGTLADDPAAVVDLLGLGEDGARHIDRAEPAAPVQQEAMRDAAVVGIDAHDLAPTLIPTEPSPCGAVVLKFARTSMVT
jgi:hypothetical protein